MFVLKIVQIIVAVLLMVAILLQNKGSAVSGVFGGGGGNVYMTKRGFDKVLFYSTIVLAAVFFGLSLAAFIV